MSFTLHHAPLTGLRSAEAAPSSSSANATLGSGSGCNTLDEKSINELVDALQLGSDPALKDYDPSSFMELEKLFTQVFTTPSDAGPGFVLPNTSALPSIVDGKSGHGLTGEKQPDDGRPPELTRSLIKLEKLGARVFWEDSKQLKEDVLSTLRGIKRAEIAQREKRDKLLGARSSAWNPARMGESSRKRGRTDSVYAVSEYPIPKRRRGGTGRRGDHYEPTPDYRVLVANEAEESMGAEGQYAWPVLVKNLHPDASMEDVRVTFNSYGIVLSVDLVYATPTSKSVLVLFDEEFAAFKAVRDLDGQNADGRYLSVQVVGDEARTIDLDRPLR